MLPTDSRWLPAVALGAAVATAYVAGLATGVLGERDPQPAATATGVLDEAMTRIQDQAARPVEEDVLRRAAVEGMLRAVGDRWSRYLDPTDYTSFQDELEGRYTGVGLWLSSGRGGILVSGVQEASPAEAAGLLPGDVLLEIDGRAVAADPLGDVAEALRGDAGSTVALMVSRDGEDVEFSVRRAEVTTDDVNVTRLNGGIQVVEIRSFSRGVGRDVRDALTLDTGARSGGVVLDLRGNPGGLLTEAVDVAGAFLDGGPVVSYETRASGTRTLESLAPGDTTTPVVVLVDGGTASAAEVVAAALQDRNRAIVVGTRTYGKGSVQESAVLSDGSAIELTVGRYRTPSGRLIDGVGVEPDVVADGTTAGPEAAEARAIEVLRGLVASAGGPG
ncbi:MAG: S41 family peptidase [Candidatus Nanopelagicales bacterium]